jgi:precorrin-6A/cobalt-precorrin-6A reductase
MNILVMAGTKDAVKIIEKLSENKKSYSSDFSNKNSLNILATTTTSYGADIAKKAGANEVISKPLTSDELVDLIEKKDVDILIDATHPYAVQATVNAIYSAKKTSVKYIRYERPSLDYSHVEGVRLVKSFKEAGAVALGILKDNLNFYKKEGTLKSGKKIMPQKVMHLAGVSTIKSVLESVPKDQLVVRVLPNTTSIGQCQELGFSGENIVAMQGVFSKEFNKSLMKEYHAEVIISKESGHTGGVPDKIEAALELGLEVILVVRPEIKELEKESVVNSLEELEKEFKLLINL